MAEPTTFGSRGLENRSPQAATADALRAPGGATGVLLIHGLGGTPTELRPLTEALRLAGHLVVAPVLPGHGSAATQLAVTPWRDWLAALGEALDALRGRCSTVVVGGLSMGAILAIGLALERERDVDGLALLAPALSLDGWAMPWALRAALALPPVLLPRHLAVSERPPFGLKDERMRALVVEAFRSGDPSEAGVFATPLGALTTFGDLVRHVSPDLGRIRQPTLILHPREDDVASLANAHRLQLSLGGPVETHVLDDSYHLVTIDRQRRRVTSLVGRFVAEVSQSRRDRERSPQPSRPPARSVTQRRRYLM